MSPALAGRFLKSGSPAKSVSNFFTIVGNFRNEGNVKLTMVNQSNLSLVNGIYANVSIFTIFFKL